MSDVLTLIKQTYATDENGIQSVTAETNHDVFCEINPVSRSEWYNAGIQGLKPAFTARMPSCNYDGELIAELAGVRYSIYRTYQNGFDIELYLQEEGGINA